MLRGVLICCILFYAMPLVAQEAIEVGDNLYIILPGEEGFNTVFPVNRKGNITLPEMGEIHVQNMELDAATLHVKQQLSDVFLDLDKFAMTKRERSLPVTVLGYVRNPGPVILGSQGNIQMAIAQAGGLRPGAQLDRVQLRRDNKVQIFDYKSYLDSGDVSTLPELAPLDIIFVPVSSLLGNVQVDFDARTLAEKGDASDDNSSVKVFGEVRNPGNFAYKKDMNTLDMIMRAGGVTRYAGVEQIRIIHNGVPKPFDLKLYLDTADMKYMPEISPSDIIFVPQKSEAAQGGQRNIYVMGEVHNRGPLEVQGATPFMTVLANAGGPNRFADTRKLKIMRTTGEISEFDLFAFMENPDASHVADLNPGDTIYVPQKTHSFKESWLTTTPDRAVQIIGSVKNPGRYVWSDEMSIIDLLGHAGGPSSKADTSNITILLPGENGSKKSIAFNLDYVIKNGVEADALPVIIGGTMVTVPELPDDPHDNKSQWVRQSSEASIYVFGEVNAPGRYAFNESLSFLDLISAADGPSANADMRNIKVTHRDGEETRVSDVNLAEYFQTGDESIIPHIKPQDVIYIPEKNPHWLDVPKELTIRVLGEVRNPGRYRFEDRMTILDLLAEAGGLTPRAVQDAVLIVNGETPDKPQVFDLLRFATTGNHKNLPTIRQGDTIYLLDEEDTAWRKFIKGTRDIVSVIALPLTIIGLGGGS